MIVRVQFISAQSGNVIHAWSLFILPEDTTLLETFTGIFSNKISFGRKLDFEFYSGDGVMASVKSSKKVPTELMPAPLSLYLRDIKEYDSALYVQFELNENTSQRSEEDGNEIPPAETNVDEPMGTITNVLMNRQQSYISLKPESGKGDIKQFNVLVTMVMEKRFGVPPGSLDDFSACLELFSSLLWEVDPHYEKIKMHGGKRFPDIVVNRLLGFNNPKKHGHKVKQFDFSSVLPKVILSK